MAISPKAFAAFKARLARTVVGQNQTINALLVALLTGGHVILEGVPGTAKTLLVKQIALGLQAQFRRVQLTPDVLPADILGTHIFDLNSRTFTLKQGPIFTEILLADEINRTPPKTQAALLEAMEERQVTLDGETLALSPLFWVIATQNPLEFEGTYPLPEAQLDRFLFKVVVNYPAVEAEKQMLLNLGTAPHDHEPPLLDVAMILAAQQAARGVKVADAVVDYLLALVGRSRQTRDLALGASPRAAVAWFRASQAYAWLGGRDFVTPDDVKAIAPDLLRHRLILSPDALLDGVTVDTVIQGLLNAVPVPR
ncbi:MoxR family ATPase [Spirulina sp. CCNP1310]|uniref:AAA family ATPase n=1 Tax=Spirulina sp. CCNP1310 TaxID=3110249 RepID=UPI002B21DF33|nr:MoxR family ATPase [Spirulina sp. CCNP1310]MEA5420057.1 MoxR family ATPase [Spirulina sp. CCNP1310]